MSEPQVTAQPNILEAIASKLGPSGALVLFGLLCEVEREAREDAETLRIVRSAFLKADESSVAAVIGMLSKWEPDVLAPAFVNFATWIREHLVFATADEFANMLKELDAAKSEQIASATRLLRDLFAGTLLQQKSEPN
jgi:hypothetical protein